MNSRAKTIEQRRGKRKKGPPGRIKLADAMRQLLEYRDFSSITTEEISRTAGINEALIYRYFGDKRGLLHHVLAEYLEQWHKQITEDLKGVKGALNRLGIIIKTSFEAYCTQKVFAKIILVEVRNFPGYFESATYQLVKEYTNLLLETIQKGMDSGEIRNDISAASIRDLIIGGIEHVMLPSLFFERNVDAELFSENLSSMILNGILKNDAPGSDKDKG